MILVADVRAHAVHIIPIAVRAATIVVLMPTIAILRAIAEVRRTTTAQQLPAHHAVIAEVVVADIVAAESLVAEVVAEDSAEAASVAVVEPAEAEEDDSLEFKV